MMKGQVKIGDDKESDFLEETGFMRETDHISYDRTIIVIGGVAGENPEEGRAIASSMKQAE